jgi:hypothetical protein
MVYMELRLEVRVAVKVARILRLGGEQLEVGPHGEVWLAQGNRGKIKGSGVRGHVRTAVEYDL